MILVAGGPFRGPNSPLEAILDEYPLKGRVLVDMFGEGYMEGYIVRHNIVTEPYYEYNLEEFEIHLIKPYGNGNDKVFKSDFKSYWDHIKVVDQFYVTCTKSYIMPSTPAAKVLFGVKD
jgi:hypothetical protein